MLAHVRNLTLSGILLFASAAAAQADADSPSGADTATTLKAADEAPIAGGNMHGFRGLLRTTSAAPRRAGTMSIGTTFQFYRVGGFATDPTTNAELDVARFVNSFSLAWAPWKFLELGAVFHVISDDSTVTPAAGGNGANTLQVAVGDWQFLARTGFDLGSGFSVGGLLDLQLRSGSGFFESSPAVKVGILALAGWSPRSVPLNVYLNAGVVIDTTESLFDDAVLEDLPIDQLNAADISSFNQFALRLGLNYEWKHVAPFLEWVYEPYLTGDVDTGDSPMRLTIGAQAWLGRERNLQLMASVDIGLTGTGDGERPLRIVPADTTLPTNYIDLIPSWNFLLRLSYRFDPFAKPAVTPVPVVTKDPPPTTKQEKKVAVRGRVLNSTTGKPVANARVRIDGGSASPLAVDPTTGVFETYPLPLGKVVFICGAEGHEQTREEVVVTESPAEVTIRIAAKTTLTPGVLRGTVSSGGRAVTKAKIQIPQLQKTLDVDATGSFSVSIKPGKYQVVVSAPGYKTQTATAQVRESATEILNFELYK